MLQLYLVLQGVFIEVWSNYVETKSQKKKYRSNGLFFAIHEMVKPSFCKIELALPLSNSRTMGFERWEQGNRTSAKSSLLTSGYFRLLFPKGSSKGEFLITLTQVNWNLLFSGKNKLICLEIYLLPSNFSLFVWHVAWVTPFWFVLIYWDLV